MHEPAFFTALMNFVCRTKKILFSAYRTLQTISHSPSKCYKPMTVITTYMDYNLNVSGSYSSAYHNMGHIVIYLFTKMWIFFTLEINVSAFLTAINCMFISNNSITMLCNCGKDFKDSCTCILSLLQVVINKFVHKCRFNAEKPRSVSTYLCSDASGLPRHKGRYFHSDFSTDLNTEARLTLSIEKSFFSHFNTVALGGASLSNLAVKSLLSMRIVFPVFNL
jgi:hypothetical protein